MRQKTRILFSLLLVMSLFSVWPGCSGGGATDGGVSDASGTDSGADTGAMDAGFDSGGTTDTGTTDAGSVDGGHDGGVVLPCTVGWAIGATSMHPPYYAVILKYDPSTGAWNKQYQHPVEGASGNDISAVDENTAWAALSNNGTGSGTILHTTDGKTWEAQALPDGGVTSIKGIKALSRDVVWAVTLDGTILNTTDGKNWNIVHPDTIYDGGLPINTMANRIDAHGDKDVWIVFPHQGTSGDNRRRSILHKYTNGNDWRLEELPPLPPGEGAGAISISALNRDVVWCSRTTSSSYDYRTVSGGGDAGTDWVEFKTPYGALNDTDDICAAGVDSFWGVINNGASDGYFTFVDVDGGPSTKFQPEEGLDYVYGGVSCCGSNMAWVVGNYSMPGDAPDAGNGLAVHVKKDPAADGGWKVHTTMVKDALWKVSFVGATR